MTAKPFASGVLQRHLRHAFADWHAPYRRVIVAVMSRLVACLLAFLIALMPSIALACEASAMLAASGPMQTMSDETQMASGADDCCHEQTAVENPDMSAANGSACSMAGMCSFAAVAAISVIASPATFAAPVSSSVFISSPSDHFLSADRVPDLRPPIA